MKTVGAAVLVPGINHKGLGLNKMYSRWLLCAIISLFLVAPAAVAQESEWNSYNDIGAKFFEDKEYARAEKILLDAVREGEKLSPDKLLKSLRLLRKVYLAMGKGAQVAQVESRMRALGDMTSSDTGSSGPTEDPATDPALKRQWSSDADSPPEPESKGMHREGEAGTTAVREKEFTISTSVRPRSAEPTVSNDPDLEVVPERRELAFATGSGISLDGSKKAREELCLVGHAGWSKTCDISSDGRKALSGSQDNSIRLWDLRSGKEIGKFEGHEDDVNCVIFSPSMSNALSGSTDKTVRLWDLDLGAELKKFEGHNNLVTAVAFSEGGSRIASGDFDGNIRIWDAATGKQVKLLQGKGTVRGIAFTPDGEQLVSGGTDKTVTLWNLRDGSVVRKFSGHKGDVSSIAISKDGTKILSSSRDLTIQLWDLTTGEPLKLLQGHSNWIQRAEFISDDRAISGGLDKTIRVWDLNYAKEVDQYKLPSIGMWSLAFFKNGQEALTANDDFNLRLWRLP